MRKRKMKIALATDHGGFSLKEFLKEKLINDGYSVKDFGTFSEKSVDYPDYIYKAARAVASGKYDFGVFFCGSGIGASIVANKVHNIRAALVYNSTLAKLSRQHNNANVLVFGGRFIKPDKAYKILKVWLKTDFSEEERHIRRINKIANIEEKENK